jgi:hypothetical protein
MIEQRTRRRRVTDTSSAAQLLAAAKDRRRVADAAEAELLELACAWADAHPPESIHDAAAFQVPGTDHEEQISGQGCPLVAAQNGSERVRRAGPETWSRRQTRDFVSSSVQATRPALAGGVRLRQ